MLDRMNGKIIHIDFGDCFEVAMTREKFPEKIPFRLTRMLINALEVKLNIVSHFTFVLQLYIHVYVCICIHAYIQSYYTYRVVNNTNNSFCNYQ